MADAPRRRRKGPPRMMVGLLSVYVLQGRNRELKEHLDRKSKRVDARNLRDHGTALHVAAGVLQPASVYILCSAGASVGACTGDGYTPLAVLVHTFEEEGAVMDMAFYMCLHTLLKWGADPTVRAVWGNEAVCDVLRRVDPRDALGLGNALACIEAGMSILRARGADNSELKRFRISAYAKAEHGAFEPYFLPPYLAPKPVVADLAPLSGRRVLCAVGSIGDPDRVAAVS